VSATKRGGKRSSSDNYGTPFWPAHRLLEIVDLPGGLWVEPGAGTGNIVRAVNTVRKDVTWIAVEERKECAPTLKLCASHVVIQDYLTWMPDPEHPPIQVALGNPPYRLARSFMEHSFEIARFTVLLLRLNYLGSEERADLMRSFPPDVYVLPNRVPFERSDAENKPGRTGSTDSIEYAWFIWDMARKGKKKVGALKVLGLTPLADRRGTQRRVDLFGIGG